MNDDQYIGLKWKDGGRSRQEGVDCAGLAALWLKEQLGLEFETPATSKIDDCERAIEKWGKRDGLERGDLIFYRHIESGKVRHVAVYLGNDRILHTVRMCRSRIQIGDALIERAGLVRAGIIGRGNVEALAMALNDPNVKEYVTIVLLILSVALSAAAYFLQPKPRLPTNRPQNGLYGFDGLITQANPTIPLPDLLGAVAVAGNSPYTEPIDKSQTVSDATQQKANKVIILSSGPIQDFTYQGSAITINGLDYNDLYFHPSGGFVLNPVQDENNAVLGTIGSDSNRPSMSLYTGAYDITVPVDVRAQYDRNMPVHGFNGCAYIVARLVNSTKFSQFNLVMTAAGRLVRTYNSSGFITTSITGESLAGADGTKVRFKLGNIDIVSVTSLTVNGTGYTLMSPTNQSGNVFWLNQTKGYIEFPTAPAAAATILVNYSCYVRAWSQNPADLAIYMVTEPMRGKGLPASKIDWPRAVTFQSYCSALVYWNSGEGGAGYEQRYVCNYAVDYRRPHQDHIQAILDSCYACMFISNGKVVFKARGTDSAVMDFTTKNIMSVKGKKGAASSFSAELVDRSTLYNEINLFFNKGDAFNAETGIVRDDDYDQSQRAGAVGNNGVDDTTLHMPAVTVQNQAERLAEQILRENVNMMWVVEFKTNIQGLALEPMDLVTVTHWTKPDWNQKLFRLEEISTDEHDVMTLKMSEYFAGAYI